MENTNTPEQKKPEISNGQANLTRNDLISFAMDVGFSIALPLALFLYIGILVDRSHGSKPTFLIVGLILSLFTTTIILIKKVKKYLK